MKDVVVSIVNHGHAALLPQCLDSVLHSAADVALEAVVLDNASDDGSAEMVRARYPQVELIAQRRQDGFAANQNTIIGPRLATARYFLLLNDDAWLDQGALAAMVRFMDAHPRVGIAGARLVYPDGSPQCSYGAFPSGWMQVSYLWRLGRLLPKSWRVALGFALLPAGRALPRRLRAYLDNWLRVPDAPMRVDWVCGACLIVRRETVEQIGLLDAQSFFMYFEDVDWCRRASAAGWVVMFLPHVRVSHHQQASRSPQTVLASARSAVRYFRKHGLRADAAIMRTGIIIKSVVMLAALAAARAVTAGRSARVRESMAFHRDLLRLGWRAD